MTRLVLTILLLLIAALVLGDAVGDYSAGGSLRHIAVELFVAALALGGVVAIWAQNLKLRGTLAQAGAQIEALQQESEKWRRENASLLRGLSAAIEAQFVGWQFTAAETEIAFLLLKGLSMKEIAQARETSERTVRQQSLSIYSKSGLAGRAELSAYFLEDLLAPNVQRSPA